MLKIHQLFLINFFVVAILLISTISFFIYQNERNNALQRASHKLDTLINITYIIIEKNGMSDEIITKLSKSTNAHIGVFNRELGKFATSNEGIISMDIFLEIREFSNKPQTDFIDNNMVMYKAMQKEIAGQFYTVVTAVNIDSIYLGIRSILLKLAIVFAICMVVTYLISKRFSKLIDRELTKIQHFLSSITNKNYKADINSSIIKEFDTISSQLRLMRDSIQDQDEKLARRSAKIRLKNTQLEGILSSVSHEFKNPIAVIEASAQTLNSEPDMDKATREKFLNKISKNSGKLVNLIDKLKIAFIDNFSLKTADVDIKALSLDVAKELMDRYSGRKVVVDGDSIIIQADCDMIRQVVLNLVENALKYSDDDIIIKIDNHSLLVEDRGIGISSEDIKLVSKKFFRVDKNSWNNSLGLGLYIVKNILKLHGFEMIISSKLGAGSTFGFKFRSEP